MVLGADDCVEAPRAWHSLELVLASILERDPQPGDQILDGARNEYLPRCGSGGDTCADMYRETAHLSVDELALTGVQTGPNVESEFGNGFRDRALAAHGAGRPVETRNEAVTGRIDLASTKTGSIRRKRLGREQTRIPSWRPGGTP